MKESQTILVGNDLLATLCNEHSPSAFLSRHDRCLCYASDLNDEKCSVCAPLAYPAVSVADEHIPVAQSAHRQNDVDFNGDFILSAKQFSKTIRQVVKQADKDEPATAYMILLTPKGTFDFSTVGVTDEHAKGTQPAALSSPTSLTRE